VTRLTAHAPVTRPALEALLADAATLEAFVVDLAYALAPSQGLPVQVVPVLKPALMVALADALKRRGVRAVLA
jgi:hypothetical protein